jgi:hypothetical protein
VITPARLSLAVSLVLALVLAFKLLPSEVEGPERPINQPAPPEAPAAVAHPEASLLRLPPPPVAEASVAVTALAESETEPDPQVEPLRPSPAKPAPAPSLKPLRSLAPVRRPAPKISQTTDANASPVSPTRYRPVAVAADPQTVREGRTLLRLLEHGQGPGIEIAWPASRAGRRQLFHRFAACYGMRLALVDPDSKLFAGDGVRGKPWDLNLDRYSGFVRRPAGRLTAIERSRAAAIAARHGRRGDLVRVFPRRVDALLLGGLSRLVGPGYRGARTIRARYRLSDGGLSVEDVSVDGRAVAGRIALSRAMKASCRRGGAA